MHCFILQSIWPVQSLNFLYAKHLWKIKKAPKINTVFQCLIGKCRRGNSPHPPSPDHHDTPLYDEITDSATPGQFQQKEENIARDLGKEKGNDAEEQLELDENVAYGLGENRMTNS